jgi:hypothetical protein
MKTKTPILLCMISGLLGIPVIKAQAETVYYALHNVLLDSDSRIDGFISWTYTAGNFENGTNEFLYLDIPNSVHNQDDLISTIEPSQIEITFDGNVHDDGVDIKMVLLQPLTPFTSSVINTSTNESKYSIGGNGFYEGFFLGGSIVPTNLTLNISEDTPGFVSIAWAPDMPGVAVLQETVNLSSNWVDSASGDSNPVAVPITTNSMFYRVGIP